MNSPFLPRRKRGIPRRLGTTLALTALVLGAGATPALAFESAPAPVTPPAGTMPASSDPTQQAQQKAKATGVDVPVDALTTSTSTTVASPDGSLSTHIDLRPVRLKRSGSWIPLDATLSAAADGTVTPAATTDPITLSGGGTSALATLTDPAGHTLALTLPFTLPKPVLAGSSATYTAVLPGVDLVASVDTQGGFDEVLVVHSAQAAANPKLKSLAIATQSNGLTLHQDGAGLSATEPDGTIAYTSSQPLMWDSTTPTSGTTASASPTPSTTAGSTPSATASGTATTSAARSALSARRAAQAATDTASAAAPASASAAPSASPTPTGDPQSQAGAPAQSTVQNPGSAAQVAPIALSTTANAVTLTPDQSLLTSAATQWPVYLDPELVKFASGNYTETYNTGSCSTQPQWNTPQVYGGEGVGYQQWPSTCGTTVERSFFTLDTSALTSNMVISAAKVHFDEPMAAQCNHTATVTLQSTGAINSSTVWGNAPGTSSGYAAHSTPVTSGSGSNCAGGAGAAFDVKADVQKFAGSVKSWTFRLTGNESQTSGNFDFARFSSAPTMDVTYDIAPRLEGTPYTSASTVTTCNNGVATWIGALPLSGSSTALWLKTYVGSGASGQLVRANFNVWDDNVNASGGVTVSTPASPYVASGTVASQLVGIPLKDGHWYGWRAQAWDGTLGSPWITNCHFGVDTTPPNTPIISPNADFPPEGSPQPNPLHYAGLGVTENFTVDATDKLPSQSGCASPCIASGIVKYIYKMDQQPTATNNQSTTAVKSDGKGGYTATLTNVAIAVQGKHTLWVKAVDKAGNASQTAAGYTFYAPWNPADTNTPGDIDGDHIPDLVASNSTGNLVLLPGGKPTLSVTSTLATQAQSPDHTSWANYQVAHRGSMTGQPLDDLYAFNTKTHQLYIDQNDHDAGGTNGFGFTLDRTSDLAVKPNCLNPEPGRCQGYDQRGWGSTSQIASLGDVYLSGFSALATIENGKLWLYSSGNHGTLFNPMLLGDGDWSHTTLLAPGSIAGTSTLWVRDNNTGVIYSYPLTLSSKYGQPLLLHAPGPLTSALSTSTSHLCLDDPGASTTLSTQVDVAACNATTAQRWTLGTDGTVRILATASATGLCLETRASGTSNGTKIDLYTCNGGANQKWTPGPNGSLVNPASGRCAGISNSSTTPGTAVILWDCDNGSEQNWYAGSTASLPSAVTTVSPTTYPIITSPGDLNSPTGGPDGKPDLYVTTQAGLVSEIYGTGITPPTSIGNQGPGNTNLATHAWGLTEGGTSTSAADTANGTDNAQTTNLSATLTNANAWTTDTTLNAADTTGATANPNGTALNLDGTDYAATSEQSVNTVGSYTVSAWVKLNTANPTTDNTAVCQRDATSARCAFYLQYSSTLGTWALVAPDKDLAQPTAYYKAYGTSAPSTNWTHLVGSFDATTGTMSLYVNGTLAGTAIDPTPWSTLASPLLIGGIDNRTLQNGTSLGSFNGKISDVRVYDYALDTNALTGTQVALTSTISNTGPTPVSADTVNAWTLDQAVPNPPTIGLDPDSWTLARDLINAADTTTPDANGTNPATPVGTGGTTNIDGSDSPPLATSADGTPPAPGSVYFDGSHPPLSTTGPAVNTQLDYTVSMWAHQEAPFGSTGSTAATDILCQTTTTTPALCLGDNGVGTPWVLQMADPSSSTGQDTITNTAVYPSPGDPTATVPGYGDNGTWDHLIATYQSTTKTLSLYVNGCLAGTDINATPSTFNATSQLVIGASSTTANTDGTYPSAFQGHVADIQTSPYALTAAEVTTACSLTGTPLNTDPTSLTNGTLIKNSSGAYKLIDNGGGLTISTADITNDGYDTTTAVQTTDDAFADIPAFPSSGSLITDQSGTPSTVYEVVGNTLATITPAEWTAENYSNDPTALGVPTSWIASALTPVPATTLRTDPVQPLLIQDRSGTDTNYYQYVDSAAVPITATEIANANIPTAQAVAVPPTWLTAEKAKTPADGTLISADSDQTVYLITAGKKTLVTSDQYSVPDPTTGQLSTTYNLNDVIPVPSELITQLPNG